VNATVCCANTQYCIIDSNFQPACCDIGSDCGNACPSTLYQCQSTTTISGTATVTAACCPRSCPSTSVFKCASVYGGGCCSYGYICESGNQCSSTVQAATSNAVVSEIPSGCTTSQIACPTSIGGGCCDNGLACTVIDNTNYCAAASGTAVRTGQNGILESGLAAAGSSGLSTGAKAGIGAGIGVGVCLVAGGFLWFCIAHRRRAPRSQASSEQAMSQASVPKSRPTAGRQDSDYFGATAATGPYTEDVTSPDASPGNNRGVPATPQSPRDITAPVEIDSRDQSNVTSPGAFDLQKSPTMELVELP
jgi:hypothetical protein